MNSVSPEPYDITEIPYIAWVPGASTWFIALGIIALLAALAWRRSAPPKRVQNYQIIDKLRAELKRSLDGSSEVNSEINIERVSRIARRAISHLTGANLTQLTADELRAAATGEHPTIFREICEASALFEEIGYAPPSPDREHQARSMCERLIKLLDTLIENRRNDKGAK